MITQKFNMSLTNQIVEKIRLILDKPATPLNFKHLTELINKQVVPQEQLLPLLLYKHRADLILFVLQRFAITAWQLEVVLASVLKNILKYQLEDLRKIWKTILQKEIFKMWRQKWGVLKLMHDAFKITNQTIKEMLFELLASNFQVLLQLNQNKIVQAFVKNYTGSYLKHNIYLSPLPILASKCIVINSQSHFKILEGQIKKQLLQRTLTLLAVTSQRKVYTYQNNCMSLVALLLREQQQNIADMLDIYECEKVLEFYLYNKPTREQARKTQQIVEKYREKISKEQKDKMNYNYEIKHNSEQKQPKLVPLIQNVIDKTNDYQLKQRRGIAIQSSVSPPKPKNINFLKKGIGNGGGKAEVSSYKSPFKIVKSNVIQQIVDNCFLQSQSKIVKGSSSRGLSKIGQNQQLNYSKEYGEVDDRTVSVYESSIEDGEEWMEISNLIDLAYQYKFG